MRRFGKKTDVGTEEEDGRIETEDRQNTEKAKELRGKMIRD